MNKLSTIAIIAIFMASCKNAGNQKFEVPAPATSTTINVPTLPLPGGDSNKQEIVTNPQPKPVSTETTPKSSTALNPKHGEPGHRCDISEGAPLNSPAVNATIPAPGNNSSPVVVQPQPAKTNVRLNPAHGEPGHDCAVAVGQPLQNK